VFWLKPRRVILAGMEQIVIPKQYLYDFKGLLMGTIAVLVKHT
jgi:hypothetical protein